MLAKINHIGRIYRTVKYIKPIQFIYQIRNRVAKPKALSEYAVPLERFNGPDFFDLPEVKEVLTVDGDSFKFIFLNLAKTYSKQIDWNDQAFGKLWNYNLQYCDFLRQESITTKKRAEILLALYQVLWKGQLPLEPYPASLRIMNVIRFVVKYPSTQSLLNNFLVAEINYLSKNLEYHLLGNHLLENSFALLMGGYYAGNQNWIKKATDLLSKEIDEQTLSDGAHFELSPMYHQIILFRVLEAIYYLPLEYEIKNKLKSKAELMLAWLVNISFNDGTIPHFNDSTNDIAYNTNILLEISYNIGLSIKEGVKLKASGYRKYDKNNFELIVDVHGISPDYQPGHAHADSLSYLLTYKDQHIIVDPGISTYNISSTRDWERSTEAHNTIVINGKNSAETWSGFRVGSRPDLHIIEDDINSVTAHHNGYKGNCVKRKFLIDDLGVKIEDTIYGSPAGKSIVSYIHFHPSVVIDQKTDNLLIINTHLSVQILSKANVLLKPYKFSTGFNQLQEAQKLCITLLEPSSIILFSPI